MTANRTTKIKTMMMNMNMNMNMNRNTSPPSITVAMKARCVMLLCVVCALLSPRTVAASTVGTIAPDSDRRRATVQVKDRRTKRDAKHPSNRAALVEAGLVSDASSSSSSSSSSLLRSKEKKQKDRSLRVGPGGISPIVLMRSVSVMGGSEFDDPNSYQNRALDFVTDVKGLTDVSSEEFLTLYALASIYYASYGQHNKYTLAHTDMYDPNSDPAGWAVDDNWLEPSEHYCDWWGVICDSNQRVTQLQLSGNNMLGVFAPEVQHLRHLEILELFNNFFLMTEGDSGNSWIAKMTSLKRFFVGTTSFEYDGVPPYFEGLPNLGE